MEWNTLRDKLASQINVGANRYNLALELGVTPKRLTKLILGVQEPTQMELANLNQY